MTLKKMRIFYIVLLLGFSYGIHAENLPIEKLKTFLAKTKSLTADFKQVTLNEDGKVLTTSTGLFYLSRPGKFRWSYQQPFKQEIVSNQGKVWFYDVDLEQVTVKKVDKSLGATPALLLSGEIDLEANFILKQQGIDEDLQWIKLLPKDEESGFNYILIGLNDDVIGGMELNDNFGQLTRIYFSNINKTPTIARSIFEFTAPKGVDVFENE